MSVSSGTAGLHARINATKASSMDEPSTFLSGSAGRIGTGCVGCIEAGEAVKTNGEC